MNLTDINELDTFKAALEYASSGIPVFPCREKRPLTSHGFKDASTDLDQVKAWWQQFPDANIGSPTGLNSFVLDVDLPDGPASLANLEEANGSLPTTLEQITGSGGKHLFFKLPQDIKIKNTAGKIGKGLDIRGAGGYVILPPSLHPSQQKYQWQGNATLQEAPTWLVKKIIGKGNKYLPDSFDNAPLSARSHLETIASAKEGQRNDTLNKSCFSIGQLITQGDFTKKEIIKYIYAAAETTGLPTAEYFKTIQNGIEAGKDSPKRGASALKSSLKELNVFPWPIVDRAMFYGFAGEFVEFATEYSEADPIAVLATFLSRFGVEVGRSPFVLAGEQQHARVNAVLVGQSSKARKGTSFMPIRELFKFSEGEWNLSHVSHGPLSSGEGLIFAVRDERTEYIVDRQKGSGKDVTVDLGIKDKRLFVLDQEFAGALSCSKRDGNTLSSIIRALFDGHKVEPLTKTSKITATDPHVAIATHITTHELSSKMDTVEAFNGFANRFLWLCVRRPKLVAFPTALDEKKLQSFRMRLLDILKSSVEYNEICFNPEARTLWADIYPSLSQDRPGLPGAIMNRAETNTIRLALLYALLDSASEITITHLKSALAFWDYCEQSTHFIFGEVEFDSTERRIIEALREVDEMDTRALYDVFSRNITKRRLENALSSLIASSRVVVEKRKTGIRGRPKNIFSLYEKNELNENKSDVPDE